MSANIAPITGSVPNVSSAPSNAGTLKSAGNKVVEVGKSIAGHIAAFFQKIADVVLPILKSIANQSAQFVSQLTGRVKENPAGGIIIVAFGAIAFLGGYLVKKFICKDKAPKENPNNSGQPPLDPAQAQAAEQYRQSYNTHQHTGYAPQQPATSTWDYQGGGGGGTTYQAHPNSFPQGAPTHTEASTFQQTAQ